MNFTVKDRPLYAKEESCTNQKNGFPGRDSKISILKIGELWYHISMIHALIFLILGMALVIKGADFLVDGASSLAKRLDIPEIVIGLTIVAFGTSAPELVVNIFASISQKSDIVLGNIIGSNLFNILVILGVSGLIYPLQVQVNSVKKEIPFSLLVAVVLFLMANDRIFSPAAANRISRLDGIILLLLFAGFLWYTFILSKTKGEDNGQIRIFSLWKTWIYIGLGFTGLFFGGKFVVDNAVIIARFLKVSEKFIGLTIIAAGTSLPELATSAVAAFKKRSDLAVGNVVGSNIFNILLIVGISSQISPVAFNTSFNFDLTVLMATTVLLILAMFFLKKFILDRWEAFILLIGYIIYTGYLIIVK